MWNVRLDEDKMDSRLLREISVTFDMQKTLPLWQKASKEALKSLLMKVKEKSKKAGLKLSFQKPKMLAYGPISSWQIDRRKGKQRQVLFSWSPRKL